MTMTTPKKTSFENQHLQSCDYFVIIPFSLNFTTLVKQATTGPQGVIQRIKELLLKACWCYRQNHKCGNLTLLFCRARHQIIVKSVPHVQHAYFLPFDQSNSLFLTASLDAKALYQGLKKGRRRLLLPSRENVILVSAIISRLFQVVWLTRHPLTYWNQTVMSG